MLEILNESDAFRTHHFRISRSKRQPWVSEKILCVRTLFRVFLKNLLQKLSRWPAYVVLHWQLLFTNVLVQFLIVLSFEGEAPTEQCIQQNSQSPDVCRWTCVFSFAHNLWRHVGGCSTKDLDFLFVRDASGKPEVDKFSSGSSFIQQDVLKLDVSVRYISLVQIVDSIHNLLPQELSLNFSHLSVGFSFQVPVQ